LGGSGFGYSFLTSFDNLATRLFLVIGIILGLGKGFWLG